MSDQDATYGSEADVIAAVGEAFRADNAAEAAQPVRGPDDQVSETPSDQGTVDAGTTETPQETDSFTHIDINNLPDELKPYAQQLMADYTRKSQANAELRKQLEGIDPNEARQAIEFAQRLNSDPQFALNVHENLTTHLQNMGLSPAQAQAEATRQMGDSGYEELDDEGSGQLSQIEQRLAQITDRFAQEDQQRAQQQQLDWLTANIQRDENMIRQAHPEYNEKAFEHIYALAPGVGGSLIEAEKVFSDMRSGFLGEYLQTKASVPSGVSAPSASGQGQVAQEAFRTLDAATPAAEEYVRNLEAQGLI